MRLSRFLAPMGAQRHRGRSMIHPTSQRAVDFGEPASQRAAWDPGRGTRNRDSTAASIAFVLTEVCLQLRFCRRQDRLSEEAASRGAVFPALRSWDRPGSHVTSAIKLHAGGSSHGGTPDGMDSLKHLSISAWVIRGANSAGLLSSNP
jgi:hypothetical protein